MRLGSANTTIMYYLKFSAFKVHNLAPCTQHRYVCIANTSHDWRALGVVAKVFSRPWNEHHSFGGGGGGGCEPKSQVDRQCTLSVALTDSLPTWKVQGYGKTKEGKASATKTSKSHSPNGTKNVVPLGLWLLLVSLRLPSPLWSFHNLEPSKLEGCRLALRRCVEVRCQCTLCAIYMHAVFVVQHSKLRSFQREGRWSEYETNDVRFRDDNNFCDDPLHHDLQ